MERNAQTNTILFFLLTMFVCGVLSLMAYGKGSWIGPQMGRKMICLGNLKLLKSALEMYYLDYPDGNLPIDPVQKLSDENYLKHYPLCVGEPGTMAMGKYSPEGKNWRCSLHGTIEEIEKEANYRKSFTFIMKQGFTGLLREFGFFLDRFLIFW